MINNKKGSVLPFVLVVFFVATTFSIVLATQGLQQNRLANHETKQEQAFLSAKSMSDYLEENMELFAAELLGSEYVDLVTEEAKLGQISAKLEAEYSDIFVLSVQAIVEGKVEQIITKFQKTSKLSSDAVTTNKITFCDTKGLKFRNNKHDKDALFSCEKGDSYTEAYTKDYSDHVTVNTKNLAPTFVGVNELKQITMPEKPTKLCRSIIGKKNENCIAVLTAYKDEHELQLEARVVQTLDIFLNFDNIDDNKKPNDGHIDGKHFHDRGTIEVYGSGVINIWLDPNNYDESFNYYTLPEIIKTNASDTVTVNIIATQPGFNLVLYNSDKEKGKHGNGNVYGNIINPLGTVILSSDSKDGKHNMGDVNLYGSIEATHVIVDASKRKKSNHTDPFRIVNTDSSNAGESYTSLGHVQ